MPYGIIRKGVQYRRTKHWTKTNIKPNLLWIKKVNNSLEIKVNYPTSKVIITSHRNFPFIEEDGEKINKYEANFNNNDLEVGEERKKVFFSLW